MRPGGPRAPEGGAGYHRAMRALCLLLAALAGCATLRDDQTVCPESRELRCATRTQCAWDRDRGCRVCQCESAAPPGSDGKPGLPPPGESSK